MKKGLFLFAAVMVAGSLVLAGCARNPAEKPPAGTGAAKSATEPGEEGEIQDALATLDPEDRKRAEAQRWCAVLDTNRLGSMGTPYKVLVNDQAVFLCCKGCQRRALADPAKTLAKVESLRARAARTGTQE